MKIMLIDGNSIINRAFYAIPLLTNKENEFTNAVYGFLNIFFKLYEEELPTHIAVVFDVPAPTFRHLKYAEYKGTRKNMPDELRPQIPMLKNVLQKMNIAIYELKGFEADDVLGSLSVKSEQEGLEVVLVSGDKDMLQLATDSVKIRIPKTKSGKTEIEDYYADDVYKLMGVTPTQFIDVKALMGDQSDNIPGVAGIGEKTAVKIIKEYGSLENAIAHADEIKPKKAAENLANSKDIALLSKELATIAIDLSLDFDVQNLEAENLFTEEALKEIQRLGFKRMTTKFMQTTKNLDDSNNENYTVMESEEEALPVIKKMMCADIVAYRIIFCDENFIGIGFSYEKTNAIFLKASDIFTQERILQICSEFFASDIKKIAHDAKKDMVYLHHLGIQIKNIVFDCMIGAYVLDASTGAYTCSDIAKEFLNESIELEETLLGRGKHKQSIYSLPESVFKNYVCSEPDVMLRSYEIMNAQIEQNGQYELYYHIEHPLIDVLTDMEIHGIKIDKQALIEYGYDLKNRIHALTREIYDLAGEEFNINSPKQLGHILFDKLNLKGSKRTKTGWSTSAEELEKIIDNHEIIPSILMYRSLAKLNSTYVEGLLAVTNKENQKIYSTFNQTATTTGRISSTEPNLQNIPIRLDIGRVLRKVFIPESDEFVFLDGDYSQIELKILAHMSGDKTLINAFIDGEDIHRITASQVFKIPIDQITDKQRSDAKAVNFGIVYGIGSFKLSQDLKITRSEAELYIEGYFEKYPLVKEFMDKTIDQAKQTGYATTMFERRRVIPELKSGNFNSRSFGERAAMNMPIQGSAADIIKIAMVKVYTRLKKENLESRIILQVHDELLLEVKKHEVEQVKKVLKEEMESAAQLSVPLSTDIHIGHNWYESK